MQCQCPRHEEPCTKEVHDDTPTRIIIDALPIVEVLLCEDCRGELIDLRSGYAAAGRELDLKTLLGYVVKTATRRRSARQVEVPEWTVVSGGGGGPQSKKRDSIEFMTEDGKTASALTDEIRKWARSNGYRVADTGRLADVIFVGYILTHRQPVP